MSGFLALRVTRRHRPLPIMSRDTFIIAPPCDGGVSTGGVSADPGRDAGDVTQGFRRGQLAIASAPMILTFEAGGADSRISAPYCGQ